MPEEHCPNNVKRAWNISSMPMCGWENPEHGLLTITRNCRMGGCNAELKFLFMPYMAQTDEVIACLETTSGSCSCFPKQSPETVWVNIVPCINLMTEGLQNPVVFFQHYAEDNAEDLQIKSAADMGR